MIKQTAGRDALGEFAPEFAHFNDDILFGENWNNQDINLKTRCIITVVALMASGVTDSSLQYHLSNAKNNGVTKEEMAAVITHVAFYAGWPKAWAVFTMAKEIWNDVSFQTPDSSTDDNGRADYEKTIMFPVGEDNEAFAPYFVGKSYLAPVSVEQLGIFNVTFEPGCRNNWHVHRADVYKRQEYGLTTVDLISYAQAIVK